MREIDDNMANESPHNTNLGDKLKEILQALSTEEGQAELKKLTESLEAVKIRDKGHDREKDYVHVGTESQKSRTPYSSTLSINAVETWEKQLLSEPKVGCVLSRSGGPD